MTSEQLITHIDTMLANTVNGNRQAHVQIQNCLNLVRQQLQREQEQQQAEAEKQDVKKPKPQAKSKK